MVQIICLFVCFLNLALVNFHLIDFCRDMENDMVKVVYWFLNNEVATHTVRRNHNYYIIGETGYVSVRHG